MKKVWIRIILIIAFFTPTLVYAHPGRTDGSGCHNCKTNCASWGLEDGEYHCHSGNTYTNSKGQKYSKDGTLISNPTTANSSTENSSTTDTNENNSNTNKNQTSTTININTASKKSSDVSLEAVKVNNVLVTISDSMYYEVDNINPSIIVTTTDKSATYELLEPTIYEIGNNEVIIKVTAEDNKTVKEYKLNINVELNLSDNTNISVIVNNQNVTFNDYISEVINIPYEEEKLDISYILEDSNALIELDYDKKLDVGERIIKFKVIAESGKAQIYTLNIYRYDKYEEAIYGIVGLGILGASGFGIYKLVKKKKQ